MPNGEDTVQIQMPDGRILTGPRENLPIALRMGAKLYEPSQKPLPAEPTGAVSALKELGAGAYQFGKSMIDPRVPVIGSSRYEQGKGVYIDPNSMAGALLSGLPQEQQKARELWNQPGVSSKVQAAGHELASVIPGIGPLAASAGEKLGKRDVGGAAVMGAAALLGAKGLGHSEEEIRATPPEQVKQAANAGAKNILTSIFNEGPTREKMQKLQDYDALHTKAKIATLDKAVEQDAGSLMQRTSQAVDQKFPQGSTDLNATVDVIKKGLGENVKAKTIRAKLPSSLSRIIDEAPGSSRAKFTGRLSNTEMKAALAMKNSGLAGEDLKSALVNLGYAPRQVEAITSSIEGTEAKPKQASFETMKQLRTELGKELFSNASEKYPGTIRRVMYETWQNMTNQLDGAAQKAGVGDDWSRGKQKYANYIRDFYGTWERGKYNQSPIDRVLKGQNASEIMDPLSGKSAQQARDLLKKYSKFGFNPEDIASDVRRYATNQKVMRFASPSKWDIILLGWPLSGPDGRFRRSSRATTCRGWRNTSSRVARTHSHRLGLHSLSQNLNCLATAAVLFPPALKWSLVIDQEKQSDNRKAVGESRSPRAELLDLFASATT